MNTYIIPIADFKAFDTWIHVIKARSLEECKDKLIDDISDIYKLPNNLFYTDWLEECDKIDLCIGEVKDIDEI